MKKRNDSDTPFNTTASVSIERGDEALGAVAMRGYSQYWPPKKSKITLDTREAYDK
jgi:hypothetical protein